VIHSIDKVLGLPTETVHAKLARDPMMTKTFQLGNQEHFNDDFKRADGTFTYLVPTDRAWEHLRAQEATAYKVLFMGEYFYQSEKILKRHLKVGASLSLANLTSTGSISVLRGDPLTVTQTMEGDEPVVHVTYEDLTARVVRGDIRCSNGYIHLVDKVIMKRREVTMSKASLAISSLVVLVVALLLGPLQL